MVLSREMLLNSSSTWEAGKTTYKKSRNRDANFQIVKYYKIETDRTYTEMVLLIEMLLNHLQNRLHTDAHSILPQCLTESNLLLCFDKFFTLICETKKPQMQGGQLSLQAGSYLFFFFFAKLLWPLFTRITTSTALLVVEIEAKWVLGLLNISFLNKSWIISLLCPLPLLM